MTAHANDLAVDVRGLRRQYGDVTAVDARVFGADPATGTRAWRSGVGIVWQGESAPAELTVRETVRPFARYYPRPRDPEEVIGPVGLEETTESRIKALSAGRRRPPDVALGLIGGPGLLLLDEPTTGFDPATRLPVHPRGAPHDPDRPGRRPRRRTGGLRAMLSAEPDLDVVADASSGPQAEAPAASSAPTSC